MPLWAVLIFTDCSAAPAPVRSVEALAAPAALSVIVVVLAAAAVAVAVALAPAVAPPAAVKLSGTAVAVKLPEPDDWYQSSAGCSESAALTVTEPQAGSVAGAPVVVPATEMALSSRVALEPVAAH